METPTQRVLCCMGHSVAGHATQYLMQRLFLEHGLDWSAISVEVSADSVADAVRGAKAMQFAALRFYRPLDDEVREFFLSREPSARTLAGFTSARPEDGDWIGWHNLGWGVKSEAERAGAVWDRALLWVHGQSRLALSAVDMAGLAPPAQLLWTDATAQVSSLDTAEEAAENLAPPQPVPLVEAESGLDQMLAELAPSVDAQSDLRLVFVSDAPDEQLQAVERLLGACLEKRDAPPSTACEEPDGEMPGIAPGSHRPIRVLAFGSAGPHLARTNAEQLDVLQVTAADLELAAEAHDFQGWTGIAPNLELLRDAYDEFYDL